MKHNGASVNGTQPLPAGESASVSATAAGHAPYLFALPWFKDSGAYERHLLPAKDINLMRSGTGKPARVSLLADDGELKYGFSAGTITIELPAARRTQLIDVVKVDLTSG